MIDRQISSDTKTDGSAPDLSQRPLSAARDQPQWRKDFPIDWPEDHYVARRDFTKFMVLTSLAFAFGQLWIAVQNFFRRQRGDPPAREIARVSGLGVGAAMTFNYPGEHDRCVLVRLGESEFVAYDQKCTHLSCSVIPEPQAGRLICPCHQGIFEMSTGRPLAGPPRRPLPRITLQVKGDVVYATGVELRTS